jgi:hypothetical protein
MRFLRSNDGMMLLLALLVVVSVSATARAYYSMLLQSRAEAATVNMSLAIERK